MNDIPESCFPLRLVDGPAIIGGSGEDAGCGHDMEPSAHGLRPKVQHGFPMA
jgi:hypothetical protein